MKVLGTYPSNVEGMASGNPSVASDVEGLRVVTKGYGVLFPHGDDKTLTKVIQKLCTDKDYREEVVKRCRERALQYDIQKMAEGYLEVYKGLKGNVYFCSKKYCIYKN